MLADGINIAANRVSAAEEDHSKNKEGQKNGIDILKSG